MSHFTKRGIAAAEAAVAEKETKASAHVSFPSNTTFKVRIKSQEDIVQYYSHGIYDLVKTFVPKTPAQRNDRGYVTSNPSLWDKASDLLYADAKALKESGDEAGAEKVRNHAYNLKAKQRFLLAFINLETGEYNFVDLTKKQADGVIATVIKYAKRLDKLAFELSKTGTSTNTVVSLSPIIDMDEDLTEAERANFDKGGETSFDYELFEGFLYEADEAEQTKNLVIAGFDISRLGLTIGAAAANASGETDNVKPIEGDGADVDPTKIF